MSFPTQSSTTRFPSPLQLALLLPMALIKWKQRVFPIIDMNQVKVVHKEEPPPQEVINKMIENHERQNQNQNNEETPEPSALASKPTPHPSQEPKSVQAVPSDPPKDKVKLEAKNAPVESTKPQPVQEAPKVQKAVESDQDSQLNNEIAQRLAERNRLLQEKYSKQKEVQSVQSVAPAQAKPTAPIQKVKSEPSSGSALVSNQKARVVNMPVAGKPKPKVNSNPSGAQPNSAKLAAAKAEKEKKLKEQKEEEDRKVKERIEQKKKEKDEERRKFIENQKQGQKKAPSRPFEFVGEQNSKPVTAKASPTKEKVGSAVGNGKKETQSNQSSKQSTLKESLEPQKPSKNV